ncbi:NTP transferase domain-containing protein [Paenibacillus sp. FSL M7-0420]|uniref:NTP transferase domain-containing protein n=1 Tax=Paenibacillus sp. FSL M7-0420 TaxID=2921609 RepID=UPI0030F7507C
MKVAGIFLAAGRSNGAGASEGSQNRAGAGSAGAAMLSELETCGLVPLVVVVRADDPLGWLPPAGMAENMRRIETCLTAHLGLSFSLRCGLNAVASLQPDAVVIAAADQPFVAAAQIRRFIQAYEQHPELDYVTSAQEGLLMPPTLFSSTLFGGLQELDDEEGVAAIMRTKEYKGLILPQEPVQAFAENGLPESFGEYRREWSVRSGNRQ